LLWLPGPINILLSRNWELGGCQIVMVAAPVNILWLRNLELGGCQIVMVARSYQHSPVAELGIRRLPNCYGCPFLSIFSCRGIWNLA